MNSPFKRIYSSLEYFRYGNDSVLRIGGVIHDIHSTTYQFPLEIESLNIRTMTVGRFGLSLEESRLRHSCSHSTVRGEDMVVVAGHL